jgi:hypothetical protein
MDGKRSRGLFDTAGGSAELRRKAVFSLDSEDGMVK